MAALGTGLTAVATDEIGLTRNGGNDEGYTTLASLIGVMGSAITVDAANITFANAASGMTATDAQAAFEELDGRVDELELTTHVAAVVASSDSSVTVVASGTDGQTFDLKVDPANSFTAFAAFATANPTDPAVVAFCSSMAALLISTEAGNTIRLGSDNKLYENDANP